MTTSTLQPKNAATPENTPVPGGGSWHWSASEGAWIPNTELASAPTQPEPPITPTNATTKPTPE